MPFPSCIVYRFLFVLLVLVFSQTAYGASTLQGTVFDKQRNAIPDIDVELLNDFYQSVGRSRTDASGRYQFGGLSDGRYTVRVYAFRYDLEDQTASVEIVTQNIRGGEGSGFFQQDFYLLPKKGSLKESEIGVVFAQDIPPAAKQAYENALKSLAAKRTTEGIMGLNEAIKIFPTYYLALYRIGKELFLLKKYGDALPFFYNAAEVNPKSANTLYYLGYCLNSLGPDYQKAAITALSRAAFLAPASVQVLYMLGKVERQAGKYEDSEKHLLQAKKLSKEGIPEIYIELAQLYGNDLKKFKEAADELELYLKASKVKGRDSALIEKKIADLRAKAKTPPAKS